MLLHYEEVGMEEIGMLQREGEGDWGRYCCFQIFERVLHVIFKKQKKKNDSRGRNVIELFFLT